MKRALLVLVLAACGDSQHVIEAPPPLDADPATGLVSVQYIGDGVAGGLEVFFQNADSSIVLATRTLDDGTANAFMAAGGFVTLINGSTLWTFSDVQPGDHLRIDHRSDQEQTAYRMRIPPATADSIFLLTPCGTANVTFAQTSAVPVMLGNCSPGLDLLLLTRFDIDLDPVEYLYVDSATAIPNVAFTVTGAYRPIDTSTVHVIDAPFTGVRSTQTLMGTHGRLYPQAMAGPATAGEITLTSKMPLAPGARLLTDVTSTDFTDAIERHVVRWDPTVALAQTTEIDLAERVSAVASQPIYDPTSSSISWTEDEGGTRPTSVLAAFTFDFSNTWWIAAPHGEGTLIHVPVLPGVGHQPADAISVFELTTIASDGGYAALRERLAGWRPTSDPWPLTGGSGHALYARPSGLGPIGPGGD